MTIITMRRWLIELLRIKERGPVDFHTIDKECFGVGWSDDFPEIHGYPTNHGIAPLREAVVVLYEHVPAVRSVTVAFVENGALAPGPIAGEPIEGEPQVSAPVLYERRPVAELWIVGGGEPDDGDRALLERICELLSPYCLVGWDTGGELWDP